MSKKFKDNSKYDHEIIIHVNSNHEDTIDFLKMKTLSILYRL